MGVIKVSNSEIDIQGHSRTLTMVPFDWPHTIYISLLLQLCLYFALFPRYYHLFGVISPKLKRLRDFERIPFGSISCMHSYSSVSISTRTLKWLASPIAKRLGENLKKRGHMTLTTPLLGVVCHRRLGFDTVYLRAKLYDSNFSRSRDHWGVKIKCESRDLTTPVIRVICHRCGHSLDMRGKFDHSIASAVLEIWLVPTKI